MGVNKMRKLTEFDYMLDSYDSQDQYLEDLRSEFVNSFPIDYIEKNMTIDEYVEGKGNSGSFCNQLERGLAGLGSIRGSNAKKFGIYYSQEHQKYVINKVWQIPTDHPDIDKSFQKLKDKIVELIKAGDADNQKVIEDNPLSTMVKMKILSVYYPEKYLNIFSERMLDYFVYQFYGDSVSRKVSPYEKQKLLLKLKTTDKATKNWNNIKFGNYLYHLFPAATTLGEENQSGDGRKNYGEVSFKQVIPVLPKKDEPAFPEAYKKDAFKFTSKRKTSKFESLSKIDYVAKQKTSIAIGELGEREVIAYEKKRLKSHPGLRRKIAWQSQISDAIGYDILSFDEDGTPRQIEVKSTTDKVSDKFSFGMTENERQNALSLPNYWIYRVFDVKNKPIIYMVKNPLKDDLAQIVPVKYQVSVKVKK